MLRPDPSLRRDQGRHLAGSRLGSRRTKAGWDTLARLRKEVEEKGVGRALGPAEGRGSLGVGKEVVDTALGSVLVMDLRSLAEEDIGFEEGIDFVVERSWEQEDIALGLEEGIVAGHTELVGHREPAGFHLRNSSGSTLCRYVLAEVV